VEAMGVGTSASAGVFRGKRDEAEGDAEASGNKNKTAPPKFATGVKEKEK